jgi:class 3 adenylate cyclase
MECRLAAILVADMAGYSRLMEQDELGVLERQKAHRRELIDPEIARRGGRIVKTTVPWRPATSVLPLSHGIRS